MGECESPAVVDARPAQRADRDAWSRPRQMAGTAVVAGSLLAFAFLSAPPPAVRAVDEPQSGPKPPAAEPSRRPNFADEARRTLKKQHDRMIDLAKGLIRGDPDLEDLRNQALNQSISAGSAEAAFINARLMREVAEIAVVEYVEGVFLQDKATLEGELNLAQSDLGRERDFIELAKSRLDRIKKASNGSTLDLHYEFQFADSVLTQERKVPRAELAVKQVESKLRLLDKYTKPRRVTALKSEIEKARSIELQKRAESELAESKLTQFRAAIMVRESIAGQRKLGQSLHRRVLAALDRVIPIEAQIRTKLEQLDSAEKRDESLQKATQDLINSLEALIARIEFEQRMLNQHDRMVELAGQLGGRNQGHEDLDGQLAVQRTSTESAKASLDQAVLVREIAEIAVAEYDKEIFIADKDRLEAELAAAQGDVERARQNIEPSKDRLNRLKSASTQAVSDIALEFLHEGAVHSAEFEVTRAEFTVDQAKGKIKIILKYEHPKRLRELESDVKKAESDELARRATWDLEQSKANRLQKAIKERNSPASGRNARSELDRQALAAFDRAISLEEAFRTKLDQLPKNGSAADGLRQEMHDLSNQLQDVIDRFELARSAAQFDGVMKTARSAAKR